MIMNFLHLTQRTPTYFVITFGPPKTNVADTGLKIVEGHAQVVELEKRVQLYRLLLLG